MFPGSLIGRTVAFGVTNRGSNPCPEARTGMAVIIVETPLRISFAGGGTDFKDYYETSHGSVVSTAIDKYVQVIIKKRFDALIRVGYSRTEMVASVDEVQHDLVRESMRLVGVRQGVEIATMSDVPSEGSGLGSSSTVTVGLLHALHAYKGETVTAGQLAQEACHIELDVLHRPIGKQDQYIAAYGGLCHFTFKADGSVLVDSIKIGERTQMYLNESLMLFYTGITRKSSTVLEEQTSNIYKRIPILDAMRDQSDLLAAKLKVFDRVDLGAVLQENWDHKKRLASNISNASIDDFYKRALDAGASGCKIAGAGGGGFLLVCVSPKRRNAVRRALHDLRELPITLACDGSKIILNTRR